MTKEKVEASFKFPAILAAFIAAAIGCTVVRIMQFGEVINPDTGFFLPDGGLLNHAYYIALAATAAVLIVAAVIDRKRGCSVPGKYESPSGAIELSPAMSVIGAVLFGACGFLLCMEAFALASDGAEFSAVLRPVIAVPGFAFVAFLAFARRKIKPAASIGFLLIAGYYVTTGAASFMERIYTVNLSARLMFLLVCLVMSLFMLICGRFCIRGEGRFTAFAALVSGYGAAVMIVSDSVARIVAYVSADPTLKATLIGADNGFELPEPLFILQAAVVVWFLIALSCKPRESEFSAEPDESGLPSVPEKAVSAEAVAKKIKLIKK